MIEDYMAAVAHAKTAVQEVIAFSYLTSGENAVDDLYDLYFSDVFGVFPVEYFLPGSASFEKAVKINGGLAAENFDYFNTVGLSLKGFAQHVYAAAFLPVVKNTLDNADKEYKALRKTIEGPALSKDLTLNAAAIRKKAVAVCLAHYDRYCEEDNEKSVFEVAGESENNASGPIHTALRGSFRDLSRKLVEPFCGLIVDGSKIDWIAVAHPPCAYGENETPVALMLTPKVRNLTRYILSHAVWDIHSMLAVLEQENPIEAFAQRLAWVETVKTGTLIPFSHLNKRRLAVAEPG